MVGHGEKCTTIQTAPCLSEHPSHSCRKSNPAPTCRNFHGEIRSEDSAVAVRAPGNQSYLFVAEKPAATQADQHRRRPHAASSSRLAWAGSMEGALAHVGRNCKSHGGAVGWTRMKIYTRHTPIVEEIARVSWSVLNHDNDMHSGKPDDSHNWNELRDKISEVMNGKHPLSTDKGKTGVK